MIIHSPEFHPIGMTTKSVDYCNVVTKLCAADMVLLCENWGKFRSFNCKFSLFFSRKCLQSLLNTYCLTDIVQRKKTEKWIQAAFE